MAVCLPSHTQ